MSLVWTNTAPAAPCGSPATAADAVTVPAMVSPAVSAANHASAANRKRVSTCIASPYRVGRPPLARRRAASHRWFTVSGASACEAPLLLQQHAREQAQRRAEDPVADPPAPVRRRAVE